MAQWRIGLFGNLRVIGPEVTIDHFDTQRSGKILALLALSRQGRMARSAVADLLWPDDFPDATRLRLRQELSRLRRGLGPAAELITSDNEWIQLDRSQVESDIDLLRRSQELAADSDARYAVLAKACSGIDGAFLPGWDDDWVQGERATAHEVKIAALSEYAEIELDRGNPERALAILVEANTIDPCHEHSRMIAIKAHAALGSLANAMAEFQQMKRLMRERQQRSPSEASQALLENLVSGASVSAPRQSPIEFRPSVPVPVDRIFGRDDLVDEVCKRLVPTSTDRLVTLVGPGGIGKTRVALEAANRIVAEQRNVAFVSLVEFNNPEEIVRACIAAFGHQPPAEGDQRAYLASIIPSRDTVLVIDNIEHLLPEGAGHLKRILEATSGLKVLVTSRTALRIAGERVLAVPTLAVSSDAVEMLLDLWQAVRPSLRLTPEMRAQAETLVRKLDGYPLAIRLVSSRLKLRSPLDIIAEIESQPSDFQSSATDLSERHRSLDLTLSWSLAHLQDAEREMLTVLARFRSGCSVRDAESLVPKTGLGALESLLDSSLLVLDEGSTDLRVRLLEPIRQYVARVSTPEAWANARKIFVDWCVRRLNELLPVGRAVYSHEIVEELDRDTDNFRALLEEATDDEWPIIDPVIPQIAAHNGIRGRNVESLPWLEAAEARVGPGASQLSARLVLSRASALHGPNIDEEATALMLKLLDDLGEDGDRTFKVLAYAMLATTLRRTDLTRALAYGEAGIALGPQTEKTIEARARLAHGLICFFLNRVEDSLASFEIAFNHWKELGDDLGVSWAGLRLAVTLRLAGRASEADTVFQIARAEVERFGNPSGMAYLSEVDGRLALDLNEPERAEQAFRRSLELWTWLQNRYQMTDQRTSLGRALLMANRPDEARPLLRQAAEGWLAENDMGGLEATLNRAAEYHLLKGNPDMAERALRHALAMKREFNTVIVQEELDYRARMIAALGRDVQPFEHSVTGEEALQYF